MKLLYVTSKGAVHDYRFLSKLVNDYEVTLLHYESSNPLSGHIKSLKGLTVISRKTFFKSFPLTDILFFRKLVKKLKPDIIHSGYVWQNGILAALSGFHPHLSMPWGSDVLIEPDKNKFVKKLVRKVLTTADHLQCDAEFVKQKIINDYGVASSQITVFPWGIDLALFAPKDKTVSRNELRIPGDKFVILFTRPLEELYDLESLLNGFKSFAEGRADVLLLIAHEGSKRSMVEKFITDNRLENKIRLEGWIPNEKIPLLFDASDVFVSTSLSDGTSLSLLEAMDCGKGLILTRLPSNLEWVNDENGILIDKQSPVQLTEALNKYYGNRKLFEQHGRKNIEIAKERADWNKNYLKLKEIYSLLLAKK